MQPVLFLSHGSPAMLLEDDPARTVLQHLAPHLPTPKSILCISPHWQTAGVALSCAVEPETIHDFYGFPAPLYRIQYPVPGAPQLAEQLQASLASGGTRVKLVDRGLDHGAWTPLKLLYPEGQVPVLGMSLPAGQTASQLYALGRQLTHLRSEGVMIIASGTATHNLGMMAAPGTPAPTWAVEFQQWLLQHLQQRSDHLLDWQQQAPHARLAHPTTEHLDPLWVALGAAEGAAPRVLYQGYSYGSLGMIHLQFD